VQTKSLSLLLIVIALLVAPCWSNAQPHVKELEGEFISVRSKQITLRFKQVGDSVFGTHCFMIQNGNRIDCCVELVDGYSIRLKVLSAGLYVGVLKDCYDGENHEIKIVRHSNKLTLVFTGNPDPFVSDSLTFKREAKSSFKKGE
jgi:hypothetical protein